MVPLMPTSPAHARKLLDNGKASAYWNKLGIFCIILHKEVVPDNQKLVVGIDPGSKWTGWSVVGQHKTVLNGMQEEPIHVKGAVERRRNLRKSRRHRNCWRRPARFNRNRNKKWLPPSTLARWNSKVRILKQIKRVLPITDVCVEDIAAKTRKGARKFNVNFSPLEVGKAWFYQTIRDMRLKLELFRGYDTKMLRDTYRLKKTSVKSRKVFESHAVDAWVMAASICGAGQPTTKDLNYWTPIVLNRRQLHMFQFTKGGTRRPQGGTRSMGFSRGTLVRHPKWKLTYIGGSYKGRISLHSVRTGKRITKIAKSEDLNILTKVTWRGTRTIPLSAHHN
jgi:hypothetical protein